MLKQATTSNELAFSLYARLAEHIADCRTIQAYRFLTWASKAPNSQVLIARLEQGQHTSLEIIMTYTRNTEPAEEILSACEDVIFRASHH